jgi:hypothetical protein
MHTYKFKSEGSRRMGRPRLRWTEDVEKDHLVRKGKQKAVYRDEYGSVIKEEKDFGGSWG